jgi:aminoglycoside 6'-N-acetyltransferase I
MSVEAVRRSQLDDWKRMRAALWPDCPEADHARDMAEILGDPEFNAAFLAHAPDGLPVGFLEVSIRLTAEGCRPGRIGYIEGWYIDPEWRGRGLGAALVAEAESWALKRGCREMASCPLRQSGSRPTTTRLSGGASAQLWTLTAFDSPGSRAPNTRAERARSH